ncbi:aspartyl/glutamyl-tRNA amidotransferase subunit A [candidate division SR1 bacterium RAAC1_SR1_1]|nr:aspartyl/glutamyl-tRNA amidotransferase subunit A [candidate division SR1 bacterium RAAC1_SR1_1]
MKTSTISSIHEDYLSGKYSCEDFIKEKLKKAKDNTLNSCILILEDSALQQAKLVDQKIKSGKKLKDLEGIPFGVKDTFLVKDTITTGSSMILENYRAPYTATVVEKLLDQGAILIAKENNDAFGHGSTTENSHFGPTKNAIDPTLVAGGSSGGSAANVSADITTFSIGEDTGGSIRQPAGYNQVIGLKPTYGAVSRYGCMAYASSLDTVGPIAKSVSDIQLIMNAVAGKDEKDFTSISYKKHSLESLETFDFSKVKVGYYKSFLESEALDPEIKKSIETVFSKLQEKGATVKELTFFNDELLIATYYIIAMAETASNLSRIDGIKYGYRHADVQDLKSLYEETRFFGFSEETKRRIISGNQVLSQGFLDKYYIKALIAREKLIEHFKKDFEAVDFILSPVTPKTPPKIGTTLDDPLAMYMSDMYTVGFSLGKLPTISLPLHSPTGIQITGDYSKDNELLKFAYNLDILCE